MNALLLSLPGLALLTLSACQTDRPTGEQLERVENTRDPRNVVSQVVTCTEISEVCGRLYQEHAAACLDLTESAEPATRAQMRSCALTDFRQAIAHLPPAADKLPATRGLAEAVRIDRDNNPDRAAGVADGVQLASLSTQLQGMPGGAPYGRYYASNNDLNRVLTRAVPADQACGTLESARARLPASDVPDDLRPRLADLSQQIGTAMRNRSCG